MGKFFWALVVSAVCLPPAASAQPVDPKLTGLIVAVRSLPSPAVEPLLSGRGELVRSRDRAGSTPLHHAAAFGSLETMTLLLDAGADVNARNLRGSTPLHWAIHDEAKVRLLIARGADVNARQAEGRTPLYDASLLGNGRAIVRMLLDAGADPTIKPTVPFGSVTDESSTTLLPERIMDFGFTSAADLARELFDLGMQDVPRSPYTDAAVRALKAMQTAQGNWKDNESQTVALAIYAIRKYSPPGHSASGEEAIARATQWLDRR